MESFAGLRTFTDCSADAAAVVAKRTKDCDSRQCLFVIVVMLLSIQLFSLLL